MNAKWLPISAAVFMALSSASAFAADNNGWEVHGYGKLGGQWDGSGANAMGDYGKSSYRTMTSADENNNQVELQVKKRMQVKGKVWGDFVTRAEYGNNEACSSGAADDGPICHSYMYSSSSSEHDPMDQGNFEVKEAYVEMGGFDFLGSDTSIWAGQRFTNRSQGLLSKEFWKQSSGVGAGVKVGAGGFDIVSADPGEGIGGKDGNVITIPGSSQVNYTTMTSFNAYYYGVQGGPLGGSFDFDLKYIKRAHKDDSTATPDANAEDGVGGAITYNRNYYGFKGWSQTGIGYGTGLAANRGVNFGHWSSGLGKDSKSLFATSYGVAEVTKDFQLGSEVTYWAPEHVWGNVDVERFIIGFQPSYKINDNLRAILTGSYATEKVEDQAGNPGWGFAEDTFTYYSAEAALAFSVDSDYFGRPQIKPYVAYVTGDGKGTWTGAKANHYAAERMGVSGSDDQTFFGVEAEVWF